MICYTISKYDYNIKNHTEWTDYSDIGKSFNGKTLTMEEYLLVEQNYIGFILDILNENNILTLTLSELEIYEETKWFNTQILNLYDISSIIKDILRNKCWCKLKGEDFCLCFGYDFYMHIKTSLDYNRITKYCEKYSLFIK